jgi:hypothetical protein
MKLRTMVFSALVPAACGFLMGGCQGVSGSVEAPGLSLEIKIPPNDPCTGGATWMPQNLESGECVMRCNQYCMYCGTETKVYRCDLLLDILDKAYKNRQRERDRKKPVQPVDQLVTPKIQYEIVSYVTMLGLELAEPSKYTLLSGLDKFQALDLAQLREALESTGVLAYASAPGGLQQCSTPVTGLVEGTDFVAIAYFFDPQESTTYFPEEHGLVSGAYPLFVATSVKESDSPTEDVMAIVGGHPIAVAKHLQALYDEFTFSGDLVSARDPSLSAFVEFNVGIDGMLVTVGGQPVLVQTDVTHLPTLLPQGAERRRGPGGGPSGGLGN